MENEKNIATNLNFLLKDDFFKYSFEKLCLNKELNNQEKEYTLSSAILFFDFMTKTKDLKFISKLATILF